MLRGTTLLGAFAPTLRRAHTQLLYNGSTRPSLLVAFGLEARGGVSSVSHTVLHRPTALCDALRTLVPVIAFLIIYYIIMLQRITVKQLSTKSFVFTLHTKERCATRTFLSVLTYYFSFCVADGWQFPRIAHCSQPHPQPPLPARLARTRETMIATATAAITATARIVPKL